MEPERKPIKDRRLPILVTEDMHDWITDYAQDRGVSASEVVRFAVQALREQVEQAAPARKKKS